ncbi:uncharacterized protein LOC141913033 [Tubulanus polymorphus]|uniref:uncharacterized protein LOC141913033 n=1 Tax=Tubulanus polymorphus TaxID=672921 RepID=UPI003DA63D2C
MELYNIMTSKRSSNSSVNLADYISHKWETSFYSFGGFTGDGDWDDYHIHSQTSVLIGSPMLTVAITMEYESTEVAGYDEITAEETASGDREEAYLNEQDNSSSCSGCSDCQENDSCKSYAEYCLSDRVDSGEIVPYARFVRFSSPSNSKQHDSSLFGNCSGKWALSGSTTSIMVTNEERRPSIYDDTKIGGCSTDVTCRGVGASYFNEDANQIVESSSSHRSEPFDHLLAFENQLEDNINQENANQQRSNENELYAEVSSISLYPNLDETEPNSVGVHKCSSCPVIPWKQFSNLQHRPRSRSEYSTNVLPYLAIRGEPFLAPIPVEATSEATKSLPQTLDNKSFYDDLKTNRGTDTIPIRCLGKRSKIILSDFLNPENRLLREYEPRVRIDWQGVAALRGFQSISVANIERSRDPMVEVLREWNGDRVPENAVDSIQSLIDILFQLGREDALYDLQSHLVHDIDEYIASLIQTPSGSNKDDEDDEAVAEEEEPEHNNVYDLLTVQDIFSGMALFYDAYVCFADQSLNSEELKFVIKLINEMETKRGMKILVPQRDFLVAQGTEQINVSIQLIEKRCRQMITIVTPAYWRSKECEFQTQYAHCLNPGTARIVPVYLDRETMANPPNVMKPLTKLYFNEKADPLGLFWDRMYESLSAKVNLTQAELEFRANFPSIDPLPICMNDPNGVSYETLLRDDVKEEGVRRREREVLLAN